MTVFTLRPRALLLAVALVAAAPPAAAQTVAGRARTAQTEEERARRRSETAKALAEAVERARARLGVVRTLEDDPSAVRAIREVEAALQAAYSDHDRAYAELVRAQRLAQPQLSEAFNDAEFKRSLREATALQQALMRGDAVRVIQQRGYLGVTYSSSRTVKIENGRELMQHEEYPVLLSIEPGSPAEAAGLRKDDVILAYNGYDLRQRIPISQILVPNQVVKVRVRRDGKTQEIPVRVGARPGDVRFIEIPSSGGCGGPACGWVTTTPVAPRPPVAPVPDRAAPRPPEPGFISGTSLVVGPASITLVGAELRRVDGGMREKLNVRSGAVVLQVARGTAAARSGLQVLDVITKADGHGIASGTDVYRALESAVERNRNYVVLEVVRDKRRQEVRLVW